MDMWRILFSKQFSILQNVGLSPTSINWKSQTGKRTGNRETENLAVRKTCFSCPRQKFLVSVPSLTLEFDPGSGRTLAACFKHASRTNLLTAQSNLKKIPLTKICLKVENGKKERYGSERKHFWDRFLVTSTYVWTHWWCEGTRNLAKKANSQREN